ncbi:MAG: MFS transporter [Chloroflexota bacterium]
MTESITKPPVEKSRVIDAVPFNYGWVVLIVGTLGAIMSSPGQTYSVSIFIEEFIRDLGLSRSLVSTLYAVGTVTASLTLPFVGRQIDRRGPRLMVVVIALAFGLVCIYMGTVQNGFMLLLGFIGIRMLGQSSITMVSRYIINQWWVKRRGTVIGIGLLFSSVLGPGSFPPLINWLIPQYGWRVTYPMLGVLIICTMVPLGYIFFRRNPESFGLLPDGEEKREEREEKRKGSSEEGVPISTPIASDPIEENWTLAEVIRTYTFWLIAIGMGSMGALGTGLTFHIVSIFADSGLSSNLAASVFLPMSLTNALISVVSGYLIDRYPTKYLLSTALFFQVVSLLVAPFLFSTLIAFAYGVWRGVGNGITNSIRNTVWANYYGRENLGTISGMTSTIGAFSSGLGPIIFGVGRDLTGGYIWPLFLSAIVPLVLAIMVLFLKRPSRADIQ